MLLCWCHSTFWYQGADLRCCQQFISYKIHIFLNTAIENVEDEVEDDLNLDGKKGEEIYDEIADKVLQSKIPNTFLFQ